MTFFELKTPRDMLDKARREYERLCESMTIDNVFNYFVTVNHIADYIKKSNAVAPEIIDTFLKRPQIRLSRDVCDKGKHMRLTQRPDPQTEIVRSDWSNGDLWILVVGRTSIGIKMLATNTLDLWIEFFEHNKL